MIITINAVINASLTKTWDYWTKPEHVVQWNHASDDWHSPRAENDLVQGGKFNYRMEAKDGSMGFDFWGIYDEVVFHQRIVCTMGDGRKLEVNFYDNGRSTTVEEKFEAEDVHPAEMQRQGWQAILNNFKTYTEQN